MCIRDRNNTGQLNKQEFALGMHLVYGKLNGKPIPNVLPSSLIPSSTKLLDNLKNQLKTEPTTTKEKPSFGKIDALSYKNNDDDVLPNYRNRRKVDVYKRQFIDSNPIMQLLSNNSGAFSLILAHSVMIASLNLPCK